MKDINCILLCGGRGSRMNSPTKHKVCFEIDGVPAINRIIGNFKAAGIKRFIVVVGSMAGQVVECVGKEYSDAGFVFQKTPLGTGDAAKKGYDFIKSMGVDGPVLISMGDKVIDTDVIKKMVKKFEEDDLDVLTAVQKHEENKGGGRIVMDSGKFSGICESLDARSAVLFSEIDKKYKNADEINIDDILILSKDIIPEDKKRHAIVSDFEALEGKTISHNRLYEMIKDKKRSVVLSNKEYNPRDVENSELVNAAIYLFKPEALEQSMGKLTSHNAQNEFYLVQAVNILAAQNFKVDVYNVSAPHAIMTYNNARELLDIENYFRSKRGADTVNLSDNVLKKASDWLSMFENKQNCSAVLKDIYGGDEELQEERRQAYIETLKCYIKRFGDEEVVISRAPGRVNLMGRHIEHRGGCINVISINKEVIAVAGPRKDDTIDMSNADAAFEDRSFKISEHLLTLGWKDWMSYLESHEIKKMVLDTQGDWENYVKAPILRLQYKFKDRKLKGMNVLFNGNVPQAAGLSSSSAMVVATAEAEVLINGLDVTPQSFVDLCGEGEWFVGSRGGAGDHAAMKYGCCGYISHIGFFPFELQGKFKFPEGYKLIVANSHVKAKKTTNAKDTFNQRIASYEFGLMLLKQKYPEYAPKLKHLRDLNPENLNVMPSKIYEMLMNLPKSMTPAEVLSVLPESLHEKIKLIMSSSKVPQSYPIRSVILYGIAECERAKKCSSVLESGNYTEFGKLMNISHNGDRVCMYDENMNEIPYMSDTTDEYLNDLIADLKSENPKKVLESQLEMQPGGYACSAPEIDYMVDISRRVKGVLGTQISGAGFGGCIMILVKDEAVDDLKKSLTEKYYVPRNLEPLITVCTPIKGSSIINQM